MKRLGMTASEREGAQRRGEVGMQKASLGRKRGVCVAAVLRESVVGDWWWVSERPQLGRGQARLTGNRQRAGGRL